METVFLGGTIALNNWRDLFIPKLLDQGIQLDQIINPIVEHWTPEIQEREKKIKKDENCLLVFVLGAPDSSKQEQKFVSAYSLYEAVSSLYVYPHRTLILIDTLGLDKRSAKGMNKIAQEIFDQHNSNICFTYTQLLFDIVERMKQ